MLGIPLGPGALYGSSFWIWYAICSLVMRSSLQQAGGYLWFCGIPASTGLVWKKLFANACDFSWLVLAITSLLPLLCLRAGIWAFAPSVAGAEVYLCTVQMSGSVVRSSQSLQCCFLVCSRVWS